MAHLTEQHTVLVIVNKIIPDRTSMRIVAGDTTHLPATSLFRRVGLTR